MSILIHRNDNDRNKSDLVQVFKFTKNDCKI